MKHLALILYIICCPCLTTSKENYYFNAVDNAVVASQLVVLTAK